MDPEMEPGNRIWGFIFGRSQEKNLEQFACVGNDPRSACPLGWPESRELEVVLLHSSFISVGTTHYDCVVVGGHPLLYSTELVRQINMPVEYCIG